MGYKTPPLRAAFFDAEVEGGALVNFLRTTTEWASWATSVARAIGFVNFTLTKTAALNFPLIAANGGTQDLTVTVTGVEAADPQAVVTLGLPTGLDAGLVFHGFVSANDTVTVRATNTTAGAINPASATFRVEVRRY